MCLPAAPAITTYFKQGRDSGGCDEGARLDEPQCKDLAGKLKGAWKGSAYELIASQQQCGSTYWFNQKGLPLSQCHELVMTSASCIGDKNVFVYADGVPSADRNCGCFKRSDCLDTLFANQNVNVYKATQASIGGYSYSTSYCQCGGNLQQWSSGHTSVEKCAEQCTAQAACASFTLWTEGTHAGLCRLSIHRCTSTCDGPFNGAQSVATVAYNKEGTSNYFVGEDEHLPSGCTFSYNGNGWVMFYLTSTRGQPSMHANDAQVCSGPALRQTKFFDLAPASSSGDTCRRPLHMTAAKCLIAGTQAIVNAGKQLDMFKSKGANHWTEVPYGCSVLTRPSHAWSVYFNREEPSNPNHVRHQSVCADSAVRGDRITCRVFVVVNIMSHHGEYLEIRNGEAGIDKEIQQEPEHQRWILEPSRDDDLVFVRNQGGLYLEDNGGVVGIQDIHDAAPAASGSSLEWKIVPSGHGDRIFLRGSSGWLSESRNGKLALNTNQGDRQKWTIIKMNNESACSPEVGRYFQTYQRPCPTNDQLITSQAECEHASAELDIPFNSSVNASDRPAGCYWQPHNSFAYFVYSHNMQLGNDQYAICAGEGCTWFPFRDKYSPGIAVPGSPASSLQLAKQACRKTPACRAVTCSNNSQCTMRAGEGESYLDSSTGETTYEPHDCAPITCTCTTPNAGGGGHNQFTCTDGSTRYCAATSVCYPTAPWLLQRGANAGEGCRLVADPCGGTFITAGGMRYSRGVGPWKIGDVWVYGKWQPNRQHFEMVSVDAMGNAIERRYARATLSWLLTSAQRKTLWERASMWHPAEYVRGSGNGSCPSGTTRVPNAQCQSEVSSSLLSDGTQLGTWSRSWCDRVPGTGCWANRYLKVFAGDGCQGQAEGNNNFAICQKEFPVVACESPGHATNPACTLEQHGDCIGLARYGRGDRWTSWKGVSGRFKCSGTLFNEGDPYPMMAKECQCNSQAPRVEVIFCRATPAAMASSVAETGQEPLAEWTRAVGAQVPIVAAASSIAELSSSAGTEIGRELLAEPSSSALAETGQNLTTRSGTKWGILSLSYCSASFCTGSSGQTCASRRRHTQQPKPYNMCSWYDDIYCCR